MRRGQVDVDLSPLPIYKSTYDSTAVRGREWLGRHLPVAPTLVSECVSSTYDSTDVCGVLCFAAMSLGGWGRIRANWTGALEREM